ncbi:hypothetical protein DDU33_07800 [Actinobacillus porcitonsillarum]|uniref:Uncharacterized protein n=1 Tax=Actinobacillus porcitonsillarum TaxID=189834 RepID=A0A2U8FM33_9PAST|nr:hypothetical protein DDU33_07800 [Actinobacillus porcitonsillarum]
MRKILKQGYTHIYPKWQAPSGKIYRIEYYELRRKYVLFVDNDEVIANSESDVLLLYLLKHELGWWGNLKYLLTLKDRQNINLLEKAFCLTFNGVLIR